jgi:hypothetical protein
MISTCLCGLRERGGGWKRIERKEIVTDKKEKKVKSGDDESETWGEFGRVE